MLVLILIMAVIVAVAALFSTTWPIRTAEEVPEAPWLGEAMAGRRGRADARPRATTTRGRHPAPAAARHRRAPDRSGWMTHGTGSS